ncbi:hypothetical protein BB560_001513 [Smittium megazygosporum]|uniref:PABS domain-containing protein n=1 Tax=Smittium megazygosporum TaxID=133381 RepID=A0A2T9ZHB5_9FUNG|nr:hypothetical protein BB560_001513 [Smittium megazygosporum]
MVVTRRQAADRSAALTQQKKEFLENYPKPITVQKLLAVGPDNPAYFAGFIITYAVAISIASMFSIGGQYLEPMYGPFLSRRGHFFGFVISCLSGLIFGNQTFKLFLFNTRDTLVDYSHRFSKAKEAVLSSKSSNSSQSSAISDFELEIKVQNETSQYMHSYDTRLIKLISFFIDISAFLIASAPLRLELVFRYLALNSSKLGPIWGPVIAHAALDYPIYILLMLICMLVSSRISSFGSIPRMRLTLGYSYFFIIFTIAFVFYFISSRRPICDAINFQAVLLGLSGIILKLTVYYKNHHDKNLIVNYLEENVYTKESSGESSKPKDDKKLTKDQIYKKAVNKSIRRKKNLREFLLMTPILFTILAIYNSVFYNMNCSKSATPMHNTNPNVQVLYKQESPFGFVEVTELVTTQKLRVLRVGNAILGGVWDSTKESVYGTFYLYDACLFVKDRPKPEHPQALQIGLGIGVSATSFVNHGVSVDVVELNPVVHKAAADYFGFPTESTNVYLVDGRPFIENATSSSYDYIIHDIFSGDPIPYYMISEQFFNHTKRILKPNGILAMNYVGYPSDVFSLSVLVNTLSTSFSNIRIFIEDEKEKKRFQNMVFFASNEPIEFEFPESELAPSYKDSGEYLTIRAESLRNMYKNELYFKKEFLEAKEQFENNADVLDLKITDTENPLTSVYLNNAIGYYTSLQTYLPPEFWFTF